jgi:hypothetical protein
MAIFNSKLLVYQRVMGIVWLWSLSSQSLKLRKCGVQTSVQSCAQQISSWVGTSKDLRIKLETISLSLFLVLVILSVGQ